MITMIQKFMREEAKLKKQIEAENRTGEEQKAKMKKFEHDFEGRGCGELEVYHDQLIKMERVIKDLQNK
ncbi:hypothetical protein HU200_040467 [Digitaria exilis]|uniref:Uncharacterized protein n=1 Tax=Digitaria exilis TaxID=1010633 RepID=A0A835B8R0_9POAL|nr:hypothetical protein HU200_040467 [Digitaria exilis]